MIPPTPPAPEEHDYHPHFQLHQTPVVTPTPIVPPDYSGQLLKVQKVTPLPAPQQPLVVTPTPKALAECGGQQYLEPYQTMVVTPALTAPGDLCGHLWTP